MRTIQQHYECMTLHDDGTISRRNWPASGHWRITGAADRDNFGNLRRFYTLAEILENPTAIPWRYKNGNQRTFLCDMDHGTPREWRNPPHRVF